MTHQLLEKLKDRSYEPTEDDIYLVCSYRANRFSQQTSPYLRQLLLHPNFVVNRPLYRFNGRPINIAITARNIHTIIQLIRRGADPGSIALEPIKNMNHPLLDAILVNRPDIARVLIDAGADTAVKIDTKKRFFNTPPGSLMNIAAAHGSVGMVQTLLDCKASILFSSNEYGETPLITAVQHQKPATVALFLTQMKGYELSHESHSFGDKTLPKLTALGHAKRILEQSSKTFEKTPRMIVAMLKAASPKKSFRARLGF